MTEKLNLDDIEREFEEFPVGPVVKIVVRRLISRIRELERACDSMASTIENMDKAVRETLGIDPDADDALPNLVADWMEERAQPAGEAEHSIPPIFYNGETKRNPEFKARVEKWTDEQNRKLAAAIDRTFAAPPAAANQAGTWQPIETAPKDGSMFLGWVSAEQHNYIDGEFVPSDVSEVDFCQWNNNGGDGYWDNMMGPIGDDYGVTHWMPLPAAPHPTESHALGGGDDKGESMNP